MELGSIYTGLISMLGCSDFGIDWIFISETGHTWSMRHWFPLPCYWSALLSCVCAQLCVCVPTCLCARALKRLSCWCHSVCLMGRQTEGVKDSQCSPNVLCSSTVYSLCVFSGGSVCPSLSSSFSLRLFVFPIHPSVLRVFSLFEHCNAV